MGTISMESFNVLMERAGLVLPQDETERLKSLFEYHLDRLKLLHSVDVEGEEVAGVFPAQRAES